MSQSTAPKVLSATRGVGGRRHSRYSDRVLRVLEAEHVRVHPNAPKNRTLARSGPRARTCTSPISLPSSAKDCRRGASCSGAVRLAAAAAAGGLGSPDADSARACAALTWLRGGGGRSSGGRGRCGRGRGGSYSFSTELRGAKTVRRRRGQQRSSMKHERRRRTFASSARDRTRTASACG